MRARGSRFAAGSSRMSTSGSWTMARPSAIALLEPFREALDVAITQIPDAHEVDDVRHRLAAGFPLEVVPRAKKSSYSSTVVFA